MGVGLFYGHASLYLVAWTPSNATGSVLTLRVDRRPRWGVDCGAGPIADGLYSILGWCQTPRHPVDWILTTIGTFGGVVLGTTARRAGPVSGDAKDLHHLMAQVVDHLHRDPAGLRLVERP